MAAAQEQGESPSEQQLLEMERLREKDLQLAEAMVKTQVLGSGCDGRRAPVGVSGRTCAGGRVMVGEREWA